MNVRDMHESINYRRNVAVIYPKPPMTTYAFSRLGVVVALLALLYDISHASSVTSPWKTYNHEEKKCTTSP